MKKHSSSILMMVLTVTAIALAIVLVSTTQERPVEAAMNANMGQLSLITAGTSGEEALLVIDNSQQKMLVYRLNTNNNSLETLGGLTSKDFATAFARPNPGK